MRSNYSRQSKSFTERRRRRAVIGWISALLAVASWIFVFFKVSFLPALAITRIDIYGVTAELVPVMSAAADKAIDGTYLGVFSKTNILIYPRGEISKAIASSSPRVGNVTVKRNGLHALAVSISEKTPAAIVCADLPDLTDTDLTPSANCHVADADGLIFRHSNESDSGAYKYNQFYMPDLAGRELSGTYATSTDRFKMWQSLVEAIKFAGIKVRAMLIKDGHAYELYAENPGGSSMVVIQMDDRSDLDVQKDNLIAFWDRMIAEARAKNIKLEWSEIKAQYPPNVYSRSNLDRESK